MLLTNRYRGSPVCAATAADIPAAIFFVYETLSQPMSLASSQFSSFNSVLVPIFRRVHFYLKNYFVLLYSVVSSFSKYLGVLVLIFFVSERIARIRNGRQSATKRLATVWKRRRRAAATTTPKWHLWKFHNKQWFWTIWMRPGRWQVRWNCRLNRSL